MKRVKDFLRMALKSWKVKLLVGFVALLVVTVLSAEFTSRPSFCPTCHYMEPFYESWKASSHNDVSCVTCHFPPGLAGTIRGKVEGLVQVVNYLARSYTRRRPWAEITDASCLQSGCHETRLLKGKVIFKGVVFDHQDHLTEMRRGKKLRCTSCHSQIVQGDHMVVTETTCFLCHFKRTGDVDPQLVTRLSNCQKCHHWESIPKEEMVEFRFDHTNVVKRNIDCTRCHSETVIGDGFVPKENCYACHFDYERLSKYDNTTLLHEVHVSEHKIECIQCHLQIQHKIQKLSVERGLDCATCHMNTHMEQLTLFIGQDVDGIKGIPNPMYKAGLNCASCHIFHEELIGQAEVHVAKPKSCETCHGKGYARLLQMWEKSADQKLQLVRRVLKQFETRMNDNPGVNNHKRVQQYIDLAKEGIHLVEVGKAIHNVTYSNKILKETYRLLERANQVGNLQVSIPQVVFDVTQPSECFSCHVGVEDLSVNYKGRIFNHSTHLLQEKLQCNRCHSNLRRHGEMIVSDQDCNSCHHKQATEDNCTQCHATEEKIYLGTFAQQMEPDVMAEAEVTCAECHIPEDEILRPDISMCESCHDPEYVDTGKQWMDDVDRLSAEVFELIQILETDPRVAEKEQFQELRRLYHQVRHASARGIHNYEGTMAFLDWLKEQLRQMSPGI